MMPGLFHAQGRIGKFAAYAAFDSVHGQRKSFKIRRIILWHPKIDRHAADN